MTWEDIIKISSKDVALTIDQLIEDATQLKLAVNARIDRVYQERLKELEMSFRDVSQDMKELMRD
jgi:hypothetical protein|tara:strand:+ start:330 stop:524 length:195 start_codon:yes stop_codon:yes gene_type:complete